MVVVLHAGQQEATALEQQNGLSGTEKGLVWVRQNQNHLLGLVTNEGRLQGERGEILSNLPGSARLEIYKVTVRTFTR